jgi:hypothetical protein
MPFSESDIVDLTGKVVIVTGEAFLPLLTLFLY